jgi:hypothetical protein
MADESIAEVRGSADNAQNLEGNMASIAEAKMRELPGSEEYVKATADMKQLTSLEKKTKAGGSLSIEDLRFLYEIDGKIHGFGYEQDPRMEEILAGRDKKGDLSEVLGIPQEKISISREEALSGGIEYHHGDLALHGETTAKGFTFPTSVGGKS